MTLKTECLGRRRYRKRDELHADVFDYIEKFCNPKRRYSTIGYITQYNTKIYNVLNDVFVKLEEAQTSSKLYEEFTHLKKR